MIYNILVPKTVLFISKHYSSYWFLFKWLCQEIWYSLCSSNNDRNRIT